MVTRELYVSMRGSSIIIVFVDKKFYVFLEINKNVTFY